MLNEIFMTIPDHRVTGRCTYLLSDLLTIALLTYICDALNISLREFFDEQTENQFCNDPLVSKVYRLTPKQRETLLAFLDSMLDSINQ